MAYYTGASGSSVQSSLKNRPDMMVMGARGKNLTAEAYPKAAGSYSSYSSPVSRSIPGNSSSSSSGSGSGSGSGGRSGGGSASGAGYSTADAYNALLAAYRQNDYSDYLNQMREAAQAAYDRGMGALNSAYDQQMNSLNSNLSSTKNQLLNNYNYSRGNIANDAAASLKQAYINRMNSERNLGQQMSAQGLSGGATETTLAGMLNNYGNARNNINTTANRSYADLENNYNNNLASAQQAYNSAVANANLQKAQQAISLENALANNQISALGDYQTLMQRENENYLNLLKSAIASGANFAFTPTEANNAVNGFAYTQGVMPTSSNYNAALQSLMNAQQTPGGGAAISLSSPVDTSNALEQFIKALRGA